jgi:hypothetical protein
MKTSGLTPYSVALGPRTLTPPSFAPGELPKIDRTQRRLDPHLKPVDDLLRQWAAAVRGYLGNSMTYSPPPRCDGPRIASGDPRSLAMDGIVASLREALEKTIWLRYVYGPHMTPKQLAERANVSAAKWHRNLHHARYCVEHEWGNSPASKFRNPSGAYSEGNLNRTLNSCSMSEGKVACEKPTVPPIPDSS